MLLRLHRSQVILSCHFITMERQEGKGVVVQLNAPYPTCTRQSLYHLIARCFPSLQLAVGLLIAYFLHN